MIKTDFYSGVSPVSGVDFTWTNTITNLDVLKSVEPFKAYYMGETPVPYLKIGTFTRTGDSADNYVYHIAVDNTRSKNRWFYGAKQTDLTGVRISCTGTKWDGTYRLINSLKPYYYNHLRSVNVSMTMYDYTDTVTLSSGETIRYTSTGYTNSNTISLGQDDIWNIFNGSGDITAVFNGVTYHLTLAMWDDTMHAFALGGTKYAFVTGIDDGSANTNPGRNGVYFNNMNTRLCVFTSVDLTGFTMTDNWYFGKCFVSQSNHTSILYEWEIRASENKLISPSMLYNGATYRPLLDEDICGWFYDADLSQAFINWVLDHNGVYALNATGTPAYRSGSADIKMLWGIDFPAWFKCCYGPIPKDRTYYDADGAAVTPTDNSPFYESYNAVPVFNNLNVFRYRTKQKTYDDLMRLLQPWQKYGGNISDDEYNPDSPTPPGPTPRPTPTDPGDEENGGSDIILPIPSGVGGAFGFITQYCMSNSQLEYLGSKLYTEFFNDPDFYQNIVYSFDNTGSINLSDMMSFFVSLRAYPFPLVNLDSWTPAGTDFYIGSGKKPITSFPTQLHTIDQFMDVLDIGSVDVPAYFGDYKDYDMQITLYLPYCGTAELSPGDVIGGTLSGYYLVDFCSGSCTAYVNCTTYDGNTFPVAILPGTLGADVPMTATNAGQVAARLQGDVLNAEQTIVSGLMGMTGGLGSTIAGAMSGNLFGSLSSGVRALQTKYNTIFDLGKQAVNFAGRGAIAAPMLSGGRGFASLGNATTAYIQIRFDVYPEPSNYADSVGIPAAETVRIGDCSGFCQFANVDVSGITADADDQQAIRSALESGIII